jgi:hypothetical protein
MSWSLEHWTGPDTSPGKYTQEIAMKHAWAMSLAAGLLLVATGIATAQAPNAPATEHPSNTTKQRSNSGTAPENMGASGWTGGRKDATPQAETTGSGPGDARSETPGNINNDSVYATGTDLKGPPAQFPATQTPE